MSCCMTNRKSRLEWGHFANSVVPRIAAGTATLADSNAHEAQDKGGLYAYPSLAASCKAW